VTDLDIVVVGGGFAGSALATVMARAGARCLLLEKSEVFVDRTKGEWIAPWGVAEAQRLGLEADIARARGHVITHHARFGPGIDPEEAVAGALPLALVPGVAGPMTQRHPDVCQVLLDAAGDAGAEALRGVDHVEVTPGEPATVRFATASGERQVSARLVVAADGRGSTVRRQLGVELHRDRPHHLFSGLLVDGADAWPEHLQMIGTAADVHYLAFPQGRGRARLYLGFGLDRRRWLAGEDGPRRFLDAFDLDDVPLAAALRDAVAISGCATYANEATWVDEPACAPGVVLVADAAGWDDPITGQGLSIALRDVRLVTELLVERDDWSPAALAPYGAERAERMRRLRFASSMTSELANTFGPEADARRARFEARAAEDGSIGMARFAALLGPEALPPEAFTPEAWERAFA
jgi:2-polyprenyl-6-methoxyphenol hydroxylase-like FAD-dependent oxidoreductase